MSDLSPNMQDLILRAGKDRKGRAWDVDNRTADALLRRGLVTRKYVRVGNLFATDITLTDAGRTVLSDLRSAK